MLTLCFSIAFLVARLQGVVGAPLPGPSGGGSVKVKCPVQSACSSAIATLRSTATTNLAQSRAAMCKSLGRARLDCLLSASQAGALERATAVLQGCQERCAVVSTDTVGARRDHDEEVISRLKESAVKTCSEAHAAASNAASKVAQVITQELRFSLTSTYLMALADSSKAALTIVNKCSEAIGVAAARLNMSSQPMNESAGMRAALIECSALNTTSADGECAAAVLSAGCVCEARARLARIEMMVRVGVLARQSERLYNMAKVGCGVRPRLPHEAVLPVHHGLPSRPPISINARNASTPRRSLKKIEISHEQRKMGISARHVHRGSYKEDGKDRDARAECATAVTRAQQGLVDAGEHAANDLLERVAAAQRDCLVVAKGARTACDREEYDAAVQSRLRKLLDEHHQSNVVVETTVQELHESARDIVKTVIGLCDLLPHAGSKTTTEHPRAKATVPS